MKYIFRLIGKIVKFIVELIIMLLMSSFYISWNFKLNPVVWRPEPKNEFYQKERYLWEQWDEFIKDYSFFTLN